MMPADRRVFCPSRSQADSFGRSPGRTVASRDYEEIRTSAAAVIVPGLVPTDIARALELDARFEGLGLGLVDGIVAAVAERRRVYRVLTSDRRDFGAIRVGPRLTRVLELLP
jgi:predicted nucleic acid-binding protein